jgi:hypothetical protein
MKNWYVFYDGIEQGPLSIDAVWDATKSRGPTRLYVWHSSLKDWMLAQDVPEVMRGVRPPPPPLVASRSASDQPLVATRSASETTPVSDTKHLSGSRMGRWAKGGALVGLLLAGIGLAFDQASRAESLAFLIGYVGAPVVLGTVVGFFLGAAVDFLTRPKPQASSSDIPARKSSRYNNLIARHWRGEFPLWVSYWVVSFCSYVFVVIISALIIAVFKPEQGFYPPCRVRGREHHLALRRCSIVVAACRCLAIRKGLHGSSHR